MKTRYYVRIGNESIEKAIAEGDEHHSISAAWRDIVRLGKDYPRSKFSILKVDVTIVPKIPRRP